MQKIRSSGRGFTLIELLVVVAIIGILASVVLASLNSARDKGRDASIKANLSNMRSAVMLIYDATGTFDTVCNIDTNSGSQFRAAFEQTKKVNNESVCLNSNNAAYQAWGGVITSLAKTTATPDKWAVTVRLSTGKYFCADYTGIAREQTDRGIDRDPTDVDCN